MGKQSTRAPTRSAGVVGTARRKGGSWLEGETRRGRGYSFGPHWFKKIGKWYLGASPSKKSVQRFKTKVGNRLVPANTEPWDDVRDELNSMLLGWSGYCSYGTYGYQHRHVDWHVYQRVRDFLARRHKVRGRGTTKFSCEVVYGGLGLIRLERLPRSCVPAVGRP